MAKIQAGRFIPLPEDFTVEVAARPVDVEDRFVMQPRGVYVTWRRSQAWLHYAGEQADESYAEFQLATDPEHLRKFSKALLDLAEEIEAKRR